MTYQNIGIIGAGAWGTALAQTAAKAERTVEIWAYEPAVVESINYDHENRLYLEGITLDPSIRATGEIEAVIDFADLLILALPAQKTAAVLSGLSLEPDNDCPVLIASKGIETKTGRFLSQVVRGFWSEVPIGILSGPSFASEVGNGRPTAVTIAMPNQHQSIGYEACKALSHLTFRPYFTDDIIGAQVGGALKNVIAIACGVAEGRGMGRNARAAIQTRGLAEIVRYGEAFGADPETFLGLSGLGDLTLTCNSEESRNFSFGTRLGKGETPQSIFESGNNVIEGVHTAEAVIKQADKRGIEMPICRSVYEAVQGKRKIEYIIKGLLERPITEE